MAGEPPFLEAECAYALCAGADGIAAICVSLKCPVCGVVVADGVLRQDYSCGHFCCVSCAGEECPVRDAAARSDSERAACMTAVRAETPWYMAEAIRAYARDNGLVSKCSGCGDEVLDASGCEAMHVVGKHACEYTCVARGCGAVAAERDTLCGGCTAELVRDAVRACMTSRGSAAGKKHHKTWQHVTRKECHTVFRKLVG